MLHRLLARRLGQPALPQLPQQSARLLPVPPAWSVWPLGGCCGGAAGSKATSGEPIADVVDYSALMQRAEEATYAEFERPKARSNRAEPSRPATTVD